MVASLLCVVLLLAAVEIQAYLCVEGRLYATQSLRNRDVLLVEHNEIPTKNKLRNHVYLYT